MRVVQFEIPAHGRRLGVVQGEEVLDVTSANPEIVRLTDAVRQALAAEQPLAAWLESQLAGRPARLSYATLWAGTAGSASGWLHPPVDAEDPHRVLITGTGLTHLGSVKSRDEMHTAASATDEDITDSRRMFLMGLEGGKPASGARGAQPEWFYKGNGVNLRGHRQPLDVPAFTQDGGEEAELVGCYVIDREGRPRRLGFALGNEWSDHAVERVNYLYLAPSKLRTCAVGPEIYLNHDFQSVELRCRVYRGEQMLHDSGTMHSGEEHMCHSLANCEDHHFKYPQHRQPGDIHLHFLGTSNLSYGSREWTYEDGDRIVVDAPGFSGSLENVVRAESRDDTPVTVAPL